MNTKHDAPGRQVRMWSGSNVWEFMTRPLWTIDQYPEGEIIEECAQRRQNDSDEDYKRGVTKELNVVMMHPLCSLFIQTYTAMSACADSFVLFLCVFYNVNIYRVGSQMAGHKKQRGYMIFACSGRSDGLPRRLSRQEGLGHIHMLDRFATEGGGSPLSLGRPPPRFLLVRTRWGRGLPKQPWDRTSINPWAGKWECGCRGCSIFSTPEKPQKGQVTSVEDTSPGSRQAALGFPLGVKGGRNSPPGSPDTRG